MNQLKVGVILSYVSILLTIFSGLIYTPFMLNLLGQSEYGLYSLIGSIVGYLSVLDMGFGNAIVRYTARNRTLRDRSHESNINGMFLILYSIIGIITILIGVVLYNNVDAMFANSLSVIEIKKAKLMMIMLIFNIAVSFPLGVFGSIIQAYEKFVFGKLVAIARSIINPCLVIPVLYLGYGSISVVLINISLNFLCLLINVGYCFKVLNTRVRFRHFDYTLLKDISSYSFFIFINIIVDKIYWSSDQFILGVVAGTSTVAVYAIAMQFNNMYMMFSTSMSSVLLPRVSIMAINRASPNEYSELMIKVGRLQYIVLGYLVAGFVLFGQEFISIWAGTEYQDAYYIVLLIMLPVTIPLIQTVGILILQANNKHGFRSIVYLGIAIINIIVSFPLAKSLGGFGCALATCISLLIGNGIVMNLYYGYKLKLDIIKFWRNIFAISIPLAMATVGGYAVELLIVSDNVVYLFVKILIFSFIYLNCMWMFALNKYEKNLVYSPLKKLFPSKLGSI